MVCMSKRKCCFKSISRFFTKVVEKVKKASKTLIDILIKISRKVFAFLKKASMAILICFAIALHLVPNIWIAHTGNSVEWLPEIGLIIALIGVAALYYHKEIIRFFNLTGKTASTVEYFVITAVALALGYYVGASIADGYFDSELTWLDKLFYVVIFILPLFFVCKYCAGIQDLIDKDYEYSKKAFLFLLLLIQMAQFFALSYIALICLNKSAFVFPTGLEITTKSELAFEVLYFSAMTLLTVGGDLDANCVFAKILVFFESAVFAVFISMIVFSGSFSKVASDKTEQLQPAEEENPKSVIQ